MEYDLKEIERVVRRGIIGYVTDDRFEDAVQEALIRAWKDMQEGNVESFWHCANRAKTWARSFLGKPHARATGAPKLTRDGQTTAHSTLVLSKVRNYIRDHIQLHEEHPTNTQIAQALGMNLHTAGLYVRKIRNGKYDHAIYDEREGPGRRRLAASFYSPTHITEESINHSVFAEEGFEDAILSEEYFNSILAQVDPENREVLYLRFVLGYTPTEFGRMKGAKHPGMAGQRIIDKAVKAAKAVVAPEVGPELCSKGHERTEENTGANGSKGRVCLACRREKYKAKARQTKGVALKTHCIHNHLIDGVRSNGRRFCKTCAGITDVGRGGTQKVLTDAQVRELRAEHIPQVYANTVKLAEKFGTSPTIIKNIVEGRAKARKFNDAECETIRSLYDPGVPGNAQELAEKYSISLATVHAIIARKRYGDVE